MASNNAAPTFGTWPLTVTFIDYSTGLACASGIAFALLHRHKTGKGQRLDLSLFDVGMHLMSHWITNHGLTGENPVRMGTGNSLIFPLRVFPTKTLSVFVAGTNDPFWRLLCNAPGRQDWLADQRYATNEGRVEHRAELVARREQRHEHVAPREGEDELERQLDALLRGEPADQLRTVVAEAADRAGRAGSDRLREVRLVEGESYRNEPGHVHQMEAITDVDLLEASTPHLDDVVRLTDKYGRQGTSAP